MTDRENCHWGSTLDDWLRNEGIREAAKVEAMRRILAWQLGQEIELTGELDLPN